MYIIIETTVIDKKIMGDSYENEAGSFGIKAKRSSKL